MTDQKDTKHTEAQKASVCAVFFLFLVFQYLIESRFAVFH